MDHLQGDAEDELDQDVEANVEEAAVDEAVGEVAPDLDNCGDSGFERFYGTCLIFLSLT